MKLFHKSPHDCPTGDFFSQRSIDKYQLFFASTSQIGFVAGWIGATKCLQNFSRCNDEHCLSRCSCPFPSDPFLVLGTNTIPRLKDEREYETKAAERQEQQRRKEQELKEAAIQNVVSGASSKVTSLVKPALLCRLGSNSGLLSGASAMVHRSNECKHHQITLASRQDRETTVP